MKRALTGIAAAAVVLGAVSPMAFAATTTSGLTKANPLPIVVNGSAISTPYEMTGKDSGNTTGFFPIYYFNQALAKIGFTATWDGTTHTWAITAPGVTASAVAGGVGTGNTTVTVNGTVVKKFNTQVAKDPAGGASAQVTTYLPIYYIQNVLSALGVKGNFSGQTGLSITSATQTSGAALSTITATGATAGDGSSANPAVSLNNGAVTLSTTLTDANGNALTNTAVTFNLSQYGDLPSYAPSVANASGTLIAPTQTSNADQYTVYTNASGVASISVTGPSGQTYAYEVTATAPYAGSNSSSVTSQPAYVEFVANNEVGLSPYAGQSKPFSATLGTAVPVNVTLPPNASGDPQANVLVTLTTTGGFFTNASGADLGNSIQVSTNSSGIAQAYLNDSNAETDTVNAQVPSSLGLSNPQPTYISFGQSGIASQIQNYSVTSTDVQEGQNVTVYGTLVDANGNPVANGQVLVVGNDGNDTGDFGYVTTSGSSSTVTDFPNVGAVTGTGSDAYVPYAQGSLANSSAGDLITADSAGNFSFTLTDTSDNAGGATFSIYPVSDGEVSGSALQSGSITFTYGSTLSQLAVAGTEAELGNNDKTLTGLSAPNHSTFGDGQDIWIEPQNAAGDPIDGQNFSYNVAVSNGGTIDGIAAGSGSGAISLAHVNAANPGLSSLTVSESFDSANSTYYFSIPGQNTLTSPTGVAYVVSGPTPDFELEAYNGNTGATTVTVTSGADQVTASGTFTGGNPTYAQNFSPANATIQSGQQQTVQFQVQDDQGNAVPNALATIYTNDTKDPLWITSVNGVALDQSENMGSTTQANYSSEPTPIPLGSTSVGYSVNLPGVVAWNGSSSDGKIQVYSDANGNVSLTLQGNGTNYYVAPTASTNGTVTTFSAVAGDSSTENVWTYTNKGTSGGSQFAGYQLWIGAATPSTNSTSIASPQQLGTLNIAGVPAASNDTAIQDTTADNGTYVTNVDNTAGSQAVTVASATTAAELTGAIQSTDGSTQTYAVETSTGTAVASGTTLVTGDQLVVTAANGTTTATYAITVG